MFAGKKSVFLLVLNCCFAVAGSSNGRMQLSESCHLGSSPSPAVKKTAILFLAGGVFLKLYGRKWGSFGLLWYVITL